jgi:hypothetical protein
MSRLSLKQAAEFAGVTKPTVLKHIKAGKVSADKDPEGRWWFDVTELVRVYGEPETGNDSITGSSNTLINTRNPLLLQQETAAQQLLLNELRRQLGEMKEERQRERDEMRRQLEREQDRHEGERGELMALLREKEANIKLLTAQTNPPKQRRWWTRLVGS